MLTQDLTQNVQYQRELIHYQQVYEVFMQRRCQNGATDQDLTEALDLQMVRLQLAELRWQVSILMQSPGELRAALDKTKHCLRHSEALIEDAISNHEAFCKQIERTEATLAESRRLLAGLDRAF